jgi:hypothetical protein
MEAEEEVNSYDVEMDDYDEDDNNDDNDSNDNMVENIMD